MHQAKSFLAILCLLLSFSAIGADKNFSVTWTPTGAVANATAVTVAWYIDDVLHSSNNRSITSLSMSQTLTVTNGQIVKCVVTFSNGVASLSAEQTLAAVVNSPPPLTAPTITNLQQLD
jgi:hypothetical protein